MEDRKDAHKGQLQTRISRGQVDFVERQTTEKIEKIKLINEKLQKKT
jgi:hypothetical protein